MSPKPKLLLLITEDWYFWSHRLPIAIAAQKKGYEVVVATRFQEHWDLIEPYGFKLLPIKLRRKSRNPLQELLAVFDLIKIYRREKPDVVHHVTIKPILYGSWAAILIGVPAIVNAVAGLGYVFIAQGKKAAVFRWLISRAYASAMFSKRSKVIFQNEEDRQTFVQNGIVAAAQTTIIRGSGVDLEHFPMMPEPVGLPTVMYAGRLLWDKGLGELIEAIQILQAQNISFRAVFVGDPDPDNPQSIPEATVRAWQDQGLIEWWGRREDMPHVLAQATIVVLPSYREGLPKVLLEAGAIGRAVIANDVVGCREVVRHGDNGLLVSMGDAQALAQAICELVQSSAKRCEMGKRGREIVETLFSVEGVVSQTLAIYDEMLTTI